MDPCPFVRLIVESLALKLPPVSKPAGPGVHPTTSPCFCTLHLHDLPSATRQIAPLPLASSSSPVTALTDSPDPTSLSSPVVFTLEAQKGPAQRKLGLIVSVYSGRAGSGTCGLGARGRQLGRVKVAVDVETAAARAMVMQSGWVSLGSGRSAARLHLVIRAEPDPRFVFQFGGEPECSPVVYQMRRSGSLGAGGGSLVRQPVFSCRFSADRQRSTRSR